ncbi:MAG: hypothetical protein F4Y47_00645 [Acidobacteriia bacterium]|nr:hypothetical protein [Terriglobia bacterium]MYG03265.1 hypothetical protein [Terriglobia bacterium]MYK11194.1 hypothetical protein [Terriglobia bacterium]
MPRIPRFPFRRALIYTHRWLGICGCILFAAWFSSGIVMMYKRMPSLAPEDRLRRMAKLDLSALAVPPNVAARRADFAPERFRVAMLGDRPVYRFSRGGDWSTVFADTGESMRSMDTRGAERIARRFLSFDAYRVTSSTLLREPDQWTISLRNLMPAHRIEFDDPAGTHLYVSSRSGEPVMETTRTGRLWGYLGAVTHWLYFTPFRLRTTLWINTVIWLAIAGCILALSGIAWGIWRVSVTARYRIRGVRYRSPYSGLMRWHHFAGLAFGLTTFTWVLSGCLSLDPWDWHPPSSPTREQREAFAGGSLRLEAVTLDRIRTGAAAVAGSFVPKELEVLQFSGEPFLLAYRPPTPAPPGRRAGPTAFLSSVQPMQHAAVSLAHPAAPTFERFSVARLRSAAAEAMAGTPIADSSWLEDYDSYYYSRNRTLPIPVLRLRFADAVRTWLYVDPQRGLILRKEERLTRLNRWLYHGLHSLDFRFLYDRRPLWDLTVITLCLGGLLLCLSPVRQAWQRLRRHARRISG